MRGYRSSARGIVSVALLVAAGGMAGCQSAAPRRTAAAEPGLNDPGTAVVNAAPPAGTQVTWVDRHPLFYKPRDYYESSGDNTIVKAAAATIIGVPVGVFGEIKQVVTGSPTSPRF
jgi:hypothetical protein